MEVCCPWDSPLSTAVEKAGGKVFRVGIHNGFDLSTKVGVARAMQKVKELKPRYLHVSPPCFPWTTCTNGNLRNPTSRADLMQKRRRGRQILKGCLKLIELQRQELRGLSGLGMSNMVGHAGGEHPLSALSWKEPSMRKMVHLCGGEKFRVDGCRFGTFSKQSQLPIRKPWGWFSSSPEIRKALEKKCQHIPGQHACMTNAEKAASATYPPALCRAFAKSLMMMLGDEVLRAGAVFAQNHGDSWGDAELDAMGEEANQEPQEPHLVPKTKPCDEHEHDQQQDSQHERNQGDRNENKPQDETWDPKGIMNKLRTIHANLGHPSNTVLCRTLKGAGASAEVLQKAAEFKCVHCERRGHALPHRTSQVPTAQSKWDVVSVDTFWWHSPHKDEKGNPREHVVGISFVDEASDYHLAAIVPSGEKKQGSIRAEEFRQVFSKDWLRILPKPKCIRFDDEGAFRDQRLIEWVEAQAVRVSVIAGEAAWQVGKHSRHLEVLKENMSLLSSELGPKKFELRSFWG